MSRDAETRRTEARTGTHAGPRRVLVTGGAGFIGSHLCDLLAARGDAITVIDDLSTGRTANLAGARTTAQAGGGLELIEADLAAALPALAGPFDEIYHLAAAVGVELVMRDPIGAIETNVAQTAALLRFACNAGPGGAPVPTLIASSSEVYGKPNTAVFSEDDDVHYGPTTVTRWSYAQSKAIDEYLALAHSAEHGLPAVCARFFNTVGPRQVGDYGMVLPRFVRAAMAGEPLLVYGDGAQSRCFCDVRDVAAVLPELIASPLCHGRVLNVGADEPISIAELAERVVAALGSRSPINHIPYDQAFGSGFEDLRQRRPDLPADPRKPSDSRRLIPLETTIRDIATALANDAETGEPRPDAVVETSKSDRTPNAAEPRS